MEQNNEVRQITKADGTSYSVRTNRNRIFRPEEWILFFNSLSLKQKPIFDCLLNTGGRITEVLNLKRKDFDFDKKLINLRITKRRTPYSDGKPREIKISSQYAERLLDYCKDMEPERYLFHNQKGGKIPEPVKYHQMLKRKLKKIGIKDYYNFSLHNIRKTTECWLNFLGKNHLILLKHFGHDKATALEFYLQTEIFDEKTKFECRQILGDLYI